MDWSHFKFRSTRRWALSSQCTLSISSSPFTHLFTDVFDIFCVLKPPMSFPHLCHLSWGYHILVYWGTEGIRRELPPTLITSPPSTFHNRSSTLPSVPSYTVVPFAIRAIQSPDYTDAGSHPFRLLALAIVLSPILSGRQYRTGKPGMLQTMGLQRARHDLATEQQRLYYQDGSSALDHFQQHSNMRLSSHLSFTSYHVISLGASSKICWKGCPDLLFLTLPLPSSP